VDCGVYLGVSKNIYYKLLRMIKKLIYSNELATSCFFRTTVSYPNRKALIKITDRCNLHCVHCFVSATKYGDTMTLEIIKNKLIPNLLKANVISVTLTGGEPFIHENIIEIVEAFVISGLEVSLCTNATLTSESQIIELSKIGNVSVNISLDGFSEESHGRFRGDKESFTITKNTIMLFAKHGLLKGLLATPNNLAEKSEYVELCEFAIEYNAKYVLMNPLSNYGRGIKSQEIFSANDNVMTEIKNSTQHLTPKLDIAYIRFPNDEKKPLASCEAGNIIYVFVNGDTTVCPYLVFAANTPQSKHKSQEFIIGNIFEDEDFSEKLENYNIYQKFNFGENKVCNSCNKNSMCGKGCPAAIISSGQKIEGIDKELCPNEDKNLI
jgi:radical SAM protein with 4Fe4S-binding SPASM domain